MPPRIWFTGAPADAMPLNSLDRRTAKASIAINSVPPVSDAAVSTDDLSLIGDAMARSGLTQKEAAYVMGKDTAQLSRELRGEGRLAWRDLWRLPDQFWCELLTLIAEAKGLRQPDRKKHALAGVIRSVEQLILAWESD